MTQRLFERVDHHIVELNPTSGREPLDCTSNDYEEQPAKYHDAQDNQERRQPLEHGVAVIGTLEKLGHAPSYKATNLTQAYHKHNRETKGTKACRGPGDPIPLCYSGARR